MAENSKIEWTDHTFNPWVGCQKISPACEHCYAETWAKRAGQESLWKGERRRTSAATWKFPIRWNEWAREGICALCSGKGFHDFKRKGLLGGDIFNRMPCQPCEGKGRIQPYRSRVFCASLADVFEQREELVAWRDQLFDLIRATPHLDWLLLTKRPENLCNMLPVNWQREPQLNVWLGTTVENQAMADKRIPELLRIPARVRFLSIEPMLGPIEFSDVTKRTDAVTQLGKKALNGIHWVIAGGESGPNARPSDPDWFLSLRDQCVSANVPFFFKQWGEYRRVTPYSMNNEWMDDEYRTYQVHDEMKRITAIGNSFYLRVGKATAGRELDGRTWDEMPEVQV